MYNLIHVCPKLYTKEDSIVDGQQAMKVIGMEKSLKVSPKERNMSICPQSHFGESSEQF